MNDLTPDQILRREYLAHLMNVAETCPSYAKKAARQYEEISSVLFKGLANRFDLEWSAKHV